MAPKAKRAHSSKRSSSARDAGAGGSIESAMPLLVCLRDFLTQEAVAIAESQGGLSMEEVAAARALMQRVHELLDPASIDRTGRSLIPLKEEEPTLEDAVMEPTFNKAVLGIPQVVELVAEYLRCRQGLTCARTINKSSCLQFSKRVRSLKLYVDKDDHQQGANMFRSFPSASAFTIRGNGKGGATTISNVLTALAGSQNPLNRIVVDGQVLGKTNVKQLMALLQSPRMAASMEVFELNWVKIDQASGMELAKAWGPQAPVFLPHLKKLRLTMNEKIGCDAWNQIFTSWKMGLSSELRHLDIRLNGIDSYTIGKLVEVVCAKKLPNLEVLLIGEECESFWSHNGPIPPWIMGRLFDGLGSGVCPNLRELHLKRQNITESCVTQLIDALKAGALPNLQVLAVSKEPSVAAQDLERLREELGDRLVVGKGVSFLGCY